MGDAEVRLEACPSCDLLFDTGELNHGDRANCTRCGHFLTFVRKDGLERIQSFTLSGLICLIIGCSFPFLAFKTAGLESVMTLPQTAGQLYQQGMPDLAFLVAGFIIVIPAVVMAMVLALSTLMLSQHYYSWMTPMSRMVFHMKNWSMVEVFFIGVLVSLIKLAHMATVAIGISFWGYAAFCIFFILSMSGLDRLQYWNQLERLAQARHER